MPGPLDSKQFDVICIGHALVDVLCSVDDEFIARFDLKKNSMQLIDAARAEELYSAMPPAVEVSGGSAANTAVGVASFGGVAAFTGRVHHDTLGEVFAHDISASGVSFAPVEAAATLPTGRSLILVTPDAERTMNTFLGAAAEIDPAAIHEEFIASACLLYVESYLWDNEVTKKAIRQATAFARANNTLVCLSLSDPFCVDRWFEELSELVRTEVDVLFANEEELLRLCGTMDIEEALLTAASTCEIVVCTRGSKGATLVRGNERVDVPAGEIVKVVDTTGAGDLFAAGVLIGLARNASLQRCGQLGVMAATEVIGHYGARPTVSLEELAASVPTA